ncbi:Isopropylmalate dehydrogenase-like domain - like 3 [Theobroma cacao]|nr:Isopropylmalate dehydrogenase-like domain - like 3 [Theobroma cacao]
MVRGCDEDDDNFDAKAPLLGLNQSGSDTATTQVLCQETIPMYEVYIYPNHAESVKGFGICHTSLLVVPNLITYPKSKTRFASAVLNNRRKVTSVYKPFCNDWLFLESCRKAVSKYPNIGYEKIIPEKCLMQLHSNLEIFDVLVGPNLYGKYVGYKAAEIVGGTGVIAGVNNSIAVAGDDYII